MFLYSEVCCTGQQRVKMAGETFVSLAVGLQNARDPVPILSEMNTLLESSASEIFLVLPRVPLLAIFACLESSNDSQVESTCLVLNKLLDALPVSTFLELSNFLELGLQHPNVRVVVLCLRQLKRCCSDPSTLPMVLAPTMLHLVTQLMGHEHLEVAKATHVILAFLCKEERTRKVILDERRAGFMGDVDHLMRKNSTVRFRVYDLFTEIAMSSSGAFKNVCGTGVLTQVTNELEDRDILLKLNCLEVLIRLLASPEGYHFIEESDVVKKLHDVLHTRNADPLASIVVPGTTSRMQCSYLVVACSDLCAVSATANYVYDCVYICQLCCSLSVYNLSIVLCLCCCRGAQVLWQPQLHLLCCSHGNHCPNIPIVYGGDL